MKRKQQTATAVATTSENHHRGHYEYSAAEDKLIKSMRKRNPPASFPEIATALNDRFSATNGGTRKEAGVQSRWYTTLRDSTLALPRVKPGPVPTLVPTAVEMQHFHKDSTKAIDVELPAGVSQGVPGKDSDVTSQATKLFGVSMAENAQEGAKLAILEHVAHIGTLRSLSVIDDLQRRAMTISLLRVANEDQLRDALEELLVGKS